MSEFPSHPAAWMECSSDISQSTFGFLAAAEIAAAVGTAANALKILRLLGFTSLSLATFFLEVRRGCRG
jgi:hypothetical protein